jgi:hypothetical protein
MNILPANAHTRICIYTPPLRNADHIDCNRIKRLPQDVILVRSTAINVEDGTLPDLRVK